MRYNRYAFYALVRNERKRLGGLSVKLRALGGLIIKMRYNRYASYALVRNERKRLSGLSVKLRALCGKKALHYFA